MQNIFFNNDGHIIKKTMRPTWSDLYVYQGIDEYREERVSIDLSKKLELLNVWHSKIVKTKTTPVNNNSN